jgi:hypothetical protein
MKKNKLKVSFDIGEVANKFLLHLKETTDCLTLIYHSLEKLEVNIKNPLPTDDFPIRINDNKSTPTLDEKRQNTLNWVLTKAFEEFINGLIKSFKETYKYLTIYSLSLNQPSNFSQEDYINLIRKTNLEIEKYHFPEFIEKIEKLLNKSLTFKEELLSINQVRNCLVHRHGIVSEKDIKNSSTGDLRLKWNSLKFLTTIKGAQKEITFAMRKDGLIINDLSIKTIRKVKIFNLGDKIEIDINDFNGISKTCADFALSLFQLIPQPNNP